MNVTKQGEGLVSVLTVQIAQADYTEKVNNVLKDYRKKATVKGFRPGTVPMGMVKQMYGKYATVEEVNKLVSEALQNYFKENKLHVLGEPLPNEGQKEVNWDKDTDFEFLFDVAVAPEINVELSKKNKADYYKITVDDKLIDEHVEGYCGRYGKQEDVETIEGTEFVAGPLKCVGAETCTERGSLLLTRMKNEKELAKFKAAKKGDTVTFNPKKAFEDEEETKLFTGAKADNAAAMEADYEFTIEALKRYTKAEVNQELFDKIFGKDAIKSEADFRARIKSDMEANFERNSDYKFLADFRKKLLETTAIELPEEFLKRWLIEANKENEKITPEQIENEFPLFMEDLRWQLISGKFVKDNNIQVSPDEIKEAAKEYTRFQLAQYGMLNAEDKMVEQWSAEILKNRDEVNRLYEMEENKKLIAFFKETIKLNEQEVSLEKFNEMVSEK
ncbi:MAG: trigger factor [Bacteroidales bacterium]|nr:trigger factor [Bacteroidales bacterium]